MKNKAIIILALSAFILSFQNCAGQKTIQSGRWVATTDFGSFELVIDSGGNSISQIKFIFSGWHGTSGSITVSRDGGWPINDRKFTIETDLSSSWSYDDVYTIMGTFADNGKEADGTWREDLNGAIFSGSWNAESSGASSFLF
jgi:hypothetical protein